MFTLTELLTYLFGSGGMVAGLFFFGKWVYEQIIRRQTEKKDSQSKVNDAILKLYDDALKKIERLEKQIETLSINKISSAARKVGHEIDILDITLLKDFFGNICDEETQKMRDAITRQMEMLRQKFDELEKLMPQ